MKKWASPLVIEPPVSRLNKETKIPVEGSPSFKDPADRRAEAVARSMFTVVGSALRPVLATALVSLTLTEWAKLLHRELGNEQVSPVCVELADQLVQGLKYVCDAALDTAPLLSRVLASALVLRRLIWLKCWSADQTSKKALAELPFQGGRLFGASLDDIKDITGGEEYFSPTVQEG